MPEWIKNKYACINIQNEDNKCFQYCIQCAIYKIFEKIHPERITHYKNINDVLINWENVKFPVGNNDIDKFEENNNGLISVNVYEIFDFNNKKTIVLHKRTKTINAEHHINLLKIDDEKGKYHYVYIKNYDKLIGSQTNNHKEKSIIVHIANMDLKEKIY